MSETVLEEEVLKSPHERVGFRWASAVHKLRDDLERQDVIRPETWQQVYDEGLSYVGEAINAPDVSEYDVAYEPGIGLVDKRGQSLRESYQQKLAAVQAAAQIDVSLAFYERRTGYDLDEVQELEAMQRGELAGDTLVVFSPFPEEAYRASGQRDLEALGYQPDRLMGFIRINRLIDDRIVRLTSIVIDNSDVEAFHAVAARLGLKIPALTSSNDFPGYRARLNDPQGLVDKDYVLKPYDQKMSQLYGGQFKAGRCGLGEERGVTEYLRTQPDLWASYHRQLEEIARLPIYGQDLERTCQRLTAGLWAAMQDRYLGRNQTFTELSAEQRYDYAQLDQEMAGSLQAAEARYESMIGCGGGVQLGQSERLLDNSPDVVARFIFGLGREKSWLWKDGFCRVKNCSTQRPKPQIVKVGPCAVCRKCQVEFDRKDRLKRVFRK